MSCCVPPNQEQLWGFFQVLLSWFCSLSCNVRLSLIFLYIRYETDRLSSEAGSTAWLEHISHRFITECKPLLNRLRQSTPNLESLQCLVSFGTFASMHLCMVKRFITSSVTLMSMHSIAPSLSVQFWFIVMENVSWALCYILLYLMLILLSRSPQWEGKNMVSNLGGWSSVRDPTWCCNTLSILIIPSFQYQYWW